MKSLVIMSINVRRLLRSPRNVALIGLGPLALIFVLGAAFGSSATTHVDVIAPHTQYADQLLQTIARQQGLTVQRVESTSALRSAIEYGNVEAGVVVPLNYDRVLRSGKIIQIKYYAQQGLNGQQISQIVQSGVAEESNEVVAAKLLKRERHMSFGGAFARARHYALTLPKVTVRTVEPNGKRYPKELPRFTSGAASQLLLFVFIISLMNSAALIETRRLGVARRMIASPTTVRSVIFGEALGRFALAAIQALLIVLFSWLLFGVEWGNGPAVAAVTVAFCLVAAGFAMLLGSTLATEQQALAVALLLGAGLGALGGSMVPLIFFPRILLDIAHITPHAWGNEALLMLVKDNGNLADVLPQVGALIGFAIVTFSLAIWRLRHELTTH
jgi:linearmycin/streptolysin S transport system permease protein